MKCKFCGNEKTKDISVTYLGDERSLEKHAFAHCSKCNKDFSYIAKMAKPTKIISSRYTISKEDK